MPDCSAITITVHGPSDEQVATLCDLAGYDVDGFDRHDFTDSDMWTHEDYDAAWGLNDDVAKAILAYCQAESLAYEAIDYGHYTWTASVGRWVPGMVEPVWTYATVDGEPLFTRDPDPVTVADICDPIDEVTARYARFA